MNNELFTELEDILTQGEMQMEAVRIEYENQMVVIKKQKAERLRELEAEEAAQLVALRQSREGCAQEGDEHEETCREKHDRTLDAIRTQRDSQLEAVRAKSVEDQLQVNDYATKELMKKQAQLKMQLKNIREQRYEQIEKIMRQHAGGPENYCPELDCSMCEGKY